MSLFLTESQVWNEDRWGVLGNYVWPNEFIGNTYQSEINYLKVWIQNRLTWMDAQMVPCISTSIEGEIPTHLVTISPNPARDEVFLQLPKQRDHSFWQLFDVTGREIHQILIGPGISSQKFSLGSHVDPQGIFIWRLINEQGFILGQGKLVRQ